KMQWFDVLGSVGRHSHVRMTLTSLQIDLKCNPGVIVEMSGHVVGRGVHKVNRDRICLAWYMHDNL
ncbi:hypothetical protein BDR07DRAFT_1245724, partial [Suillus spraguei]